MVLTFDEHLGWIIAFQKSMNITAITSIATVDIFIILLCLFVFTWLVLFIKEMILISGCFSKACSLMFSLKISSIVRTLGIWDQIFGIPIERETKDRYQTDKYNSCMDCCNFFYTTYILLFVSLMTVSILADRCKIGDLVDKLRQRIGNTG